MKKVLLVRNEPAEDAIADRFREFGHEVICLEDGRSAYSEVRRGSYDLVMTEMALPQFSGLDLLTKIKETHAGVPVIVFSDTAEVDDAVEAMKRGAADFLTTPLAADTIQAIQATLGNGHPLARKEDMPPATEKHAIISQSREMGDLLQLAESVADSRASVFIQGESGTGKELFARYIHRRSARRDKPFVAVNCAALPDTLLESELFGHEKGAFTGAIACKKGKFELAHGGTLLLDEISEMDFAMQSKLLRVLQEREIDRIGGAAPIAVDVRVIATTNRDIRQAVKGGEFREDLFYRLNVIPLHIPPLRARMDDIPLLAKHFIAKFNAVDGKAVKGLTDAALQTLMRMSWEGNVREFENVMERAVLLCGGDCIDEQTLLLTEAPRCREVPVFSPMPAASLREMEKSMILQTLDQTNGNRTHAAEILGISVRTLRNKLSEYRKKMEIE